MIRGPDACFGGGAAGVVVLFTPQVRIIVIPSVARNLDGEAVFSRRPPPGFLATLGMTSFGISLLILHLRDLLLFRLAGDEIVFLRVVAERAERHAQQLGGL